LCKGSDFRVLLLPQAGVAQWGQSMCCQPAVAGHLEAQCHRIAVRVAQRLSADAKLTLRWNTQICGDPSRCNPSFTALTAKKTGNPPVSTELGDAYSARFDQDISKPCVPSYKYLE
jgi:hypothetical protein